MLTGEQVNGDHSRVSQQLVMSSISNLTALLRAAA